MPSQEAFSARWGIKILPAMVQQCVCARCCQPGGVCSTEMFGVFFLAGMHLIIICVLFTLVCTTSNQAHTEPSQRHRHESQHDRYIYPRHSTPINDQGGPSFSLDQSPLRRVSGRAEELHDFSFLSREGHSHNLSRPSSPSAAVSLETNATRRSRNRSPHYEMNGSAFPGYNTPASDNGAESFVFHHSRPDTMCSMHRQNAQDVSRFPVQRRQSITQPTEYWV